mmetsp:Transcript_80345/g.260390  ORF Transcript_80345/g.260390 Transcript_80345/m.260390 type:complete len:515 (-) Transcript_80345:211-1755(-)|eukprot:CAMPEP_0203842062 /NCGR_PEP_ID=MMETSP0359-20131031/1765_1 /ASSEMBLY_ACC=CAM_ASM_000338 /TAXON_ID=268821 /ORGANISM="Scrippsiella Hangoei, Strain SHTV-5" /LENGTH=514 /DNA_ID=CAMNT_0050756583 /DNA_START=42 /DNA_END=1586 /DNA_ORIENTATION=-
MPWYDEEEEEEEEFVGVAPPVAARRPYQVEEEEELDVPGDEGDVLLGAAGLVQDAWSSCAGDGLRRSGGHAGAAGPFQGAIGVGNGRGGLLLDDSDDDFAIGSQRLPMNSDVFGGGGHFEGALHQRWRQFLLVVFVFAGVWVAARDRRPSEESFRDLRDGRYSDATTNSTRAGEVSGGSDWAARWLDYLPIMRDKSFDGHVAWSRYVDHGPLALGIVCLSVAPGNVSSKAKAPTRKLYEHRYLGVFGAWVPLPYLPQPGSKPGIFGAGVCVLSRCVCVPKLGKKGGQAKTGGATTSGRRVAPGSECLRFEGGSSAALNVMAIPNIVLFLLWQFPQNWSKLTRHATLSSTNLSCGRLWVLLLAPFSHKSIGEIFHTGVLLASALGSFDDADVSFPVFLALYLVGCWAAWLAKSVVWGRLLNRDPFGSHKEDWGAAGGLGAQMIFLARVRPEARFQFSLYMIPMPLNLSAWQSCFAHGLLDVFQARGRGGFERQSMAHLAAWAVGWLLADAWTKHL